MTGHTMAALLGSSLLALASPVAFAQSLPHAAGSWTGSYVGIGAGGGLLTTHEDSPAQQSYGAHPVPTYGGWHGYGIVQTGTDAQTGNFVTGARLQLAVTASERDSVKVEDETDLANASGIAMLTGRAGYLITPSLLGYGTASVAVGRFSYGSIDERWDQVDDNLDAFRIGAGIGAGIEQRLTPQVSVFAEYNRLQFAPASSTFDYGPRAHLHNWTYNYTHSVDLLQAGVNFRF